MPYQHLHDKLRTARKYGECFLCGMSIDPGTRYISRTYRDEDGIATLGMHVACEKLTASWDQDSWQAHDATMFRHYELGIMATDDETQSHGEHREDEPDAPLLNAGGGTCG